MHDGPEMVRLRIADVATGDAHRWLTARERITYEGLVLAKRRREWLAGRVAAKELVRRRHYVSADPFQRIEVAAIAEGPERGRPTYRVDASAGRFGLSIAHSGDLGVAALGRRAGERVGIDIEAAIDPGQGFDEVALSPVEAAAIAGLAPVAANEQRTRTWVVKEALLKALGDGLRARLDDITVRFVGDALAARPIDGDLAGLDATAVRAGLFRIGASFGAWVILAC